ncbi:MAG: hypothetical protein GC154_03170 [bacterium]|nr:hypothetical protein [bacterium]
MNVPVIYRIDETSRIAATNSEWDRHALDNSAPQLIFERIQHLPLWPFIEGAELVYIYRSLIEKAQKENRPLTITYRCDTPELLREMEMTIVSSPNGGVECISRIIRVEQRVPIRLIDANVERKSDETILMCSRCKDVKIQGEWVSLEDAVTRLGLTGNGPFPQISHGLCNTCYDYFNAELESFKPAP